MLLIAGGCSDAERIEFRDRSIEKLRLDKVVIPGALALAGELINRWVFLGNRPRDSQSEGLG